MILDVTSRGGLKPTSSASCRRSFHHSAPPRHSPAKINYIVIIWQESVGFYGSRISVLHTPQDFVVFNFLGESSTAVNITEVQLTTILNRKTAHAVNINANSTDASSTGLKCSLSLSKYFLSFLWLRSEAKVKSSVPWGQRRLQPELASCQERDSPHNWNYERKQIFQHKSSKITQNLNN